MYSNFSPVPRNTAFWHEFYGETAQEREASLVPLATSWMYDTHGRGQQEPERAPPSPLTDNSSLFGESPARPDVVDDGLDVSKARTTINIGFDLDNDAHRRMPSQISGDAGYLWTEAERARAKLSIKPQTVADLEAEVCDICVAVVLRHYTYTCVPLIL